ncbi:MAG: DUF2780 domain-containing protein [Candidatus Bipolaricaulis sp.]|nr:DUF2780 domain-containing protein [Candidatus Bipolaricaulis sp.]MDD5219662.1 DUF2780 domain-containing protein [Candidatus Bipolaricaulis sp.]
MELIKQLVDQLGINKEQAEGGAGLLFNLAKKKLGEDVFKKIADAVPGVQDLLKSAPSEGGVGGMLGKLASKVGAGDLGNLAGLAGGFKKLNLDTGLISKFVPIVMDFVQSKGGDAVKRLLESVLK